MNKNKLTKLAPAWHAEAVEMLKGNFQNIHQTFLDATKRAVWMGLFLNHIKERGREDKSIPHGEFLPWLEKNVSGISYTQAKIYMSLARDVAEKGNFQIAGFRTFCLNGQLPPAVEKIVEGKTQQQLFLEFKQGKFDDEGNLIKTAGRSAGCEGGFHGHKTLEQRRAWALSRVGHGIKELDKCGEEVLLLPDDTLLAMISSLEKYTKLAQFWLKTPLGKRDPQLAR